MQVLHGSLSAGCLNLTELTVNFWFNGCKPCVAELSKLNELNEAIRSMGGEVVGINTETFNGNKTAIKEASAILESQGAKLDKGYKFVWDFATSQANGTISAVALTHKWGGIGYMGDTYDNTNKRWHMKSMGVDANATIRTAYINAVEVNFTGNYLITIGLNTSNEIVIQKIRKAYRTVGLNDTMIDNQVVIMEENKITPTIFIMSNPSNNCMCICDIR